MTNKYDISIIGGGPGGYVAAIKASQLGMKVALFEEDRLGGVCLNWGCIPTKSLLHSAEFIEEAKHFGLNNDDLSKIALEKIVEKSRKASENLSKGVSSLMKKNKIDVYAVKAVPQLENNIFKIKSNDQFIESDRLILATGCKPRTIGDTKFSDLIWSSKEAMIPKFLPKNLSIIGSGAIGIEFASIYNALGSNVTVFESHDKILPQFDKDVSIEAQKIFEKKYVEKKTYSGQKMKFKQRTIKKEKVTDEDIVIDTSINRNDLLIPTITGQNIIEFLETKTPFLLDISFTANMEVILDKITKKEFTKKDVLTKFYEDHIQPNSVETKPISVKKSGILKTKYGYCYYNETTNKYTNIESYLKWKKKSVDELQENELKFLKSLPKKLDDNTYLHLGPYGLYKKEHNKNVKIEKKEWDSLICIN